MSVCKQCGKPKPDTGWTTCAACQKKNAEYEEECVRLARALRFEFHRKPPSSGKAFRSHVEMRGRKSRHAVTASHQPEDRDDA
jgi:uncharacterized Zn finger protein (UPF0148 family)